MRRFISVCVPVFKQGSLYLHFARLRVSLRGQPLKNPSQQQPAISYLWFIWVVKVSFCLLVLRERPKEGHHL